MTLAVAILLFGIYSTRLSSQQNFAQAQSGTQSASTSQSTPEHNQSSTAPAGAPGQSTPSTSQETMPSKTSTAKKRAHKKKPSIAPCDASSSAGQGGGSNAANASNASSTPQSNGSSATPPAKDCPPSKIVVRQGGTVEPSIQLAGGDKVSQKRAEANQMLGSTEANLKKIAELQLNDAQKDTVVQIRQFVDQSKAALAAGDMERGNTLAWKAKVLSEDLVQPQK